MKHAQPAAGFTRRQTLLQLGAAWAASAWPHSAQATPVPDALLLNRDGQPARLRSDVWRDRVALVNFVFTSCSSFCGVQSAMIGALQTRLAPRLGRDLVLISITLDPLSDDPKRLAEFSKPFEPGPHWWWLTGEARQVFRVLDSLGADRGAPSDHSPFLLVGQPHSLKRLVGFPSMAQLEAAILKEMRT
ncbi:MAG: SCO family protein [Hydrogenophaga sp.]|nr:SCO family protein [Hydrogenophaga sp.]